MRCPVSFIPAVALAWCLCLLTVSTGSSDTVIVSNGRPAAVISIAADASPQVAGAAKTLAEYIQKSAGAKLTVERDAVAGKGAVIHVGNDRYVRSLPPAFGDLDADGFVIMNKDDGNIVIAGPSDWGTEFGVYDFLERYAGVRWLMPGEDGEDVPARRTLSVPSREIRDQPAYFSRLLSIPNGEEFARRNRQHGRVDFHHYLLALFKPSVYGKTHPEFFPLWEGKRLIPERDDDPGWQPCFSAEGIVEEAAKNIKTWFRDHPEATSYSLGMNDSDHFCQCPKCLAKEDPERDALGKRNYSNAYFEWANRVVEEVLKEYPDKWFGTLAYWCLSLPPKTVKVHPRIVPYMTYDRMTWVDPARRDEGHALTARWKAQCPTVGWYDYIYGTPYLLPRVYFHQMGEYLRYGREAGVRASYAEIYYNWGEGPKEYLNLKLLWNPNLDVDAVLGEWYERAVGKEAAPDLAAYYAHWEKFWTVRMPKSSWYFMDEQFLRLYLPGYFDMVNRADITQSRRWLESAAAKARTVKQKKRAALLLRAFEYYEASAIAFLDERAGLAAMPLTEREALRLLNSAEEYVNMREKRLRLVEEFKSDPVLNHPIPPTSFRYLLGDRWGCAPLWAAYEPAASGSRAVLGKIAQLAASPVIPVRNHARLMSSLLEGRARPVSVNAAFDATSADWAVTAKGRNIVWTDVTGHNRKGALMAAGKGTCWLEQRVPVPGHGTYTGVAFVRVEGGRAGQGSVELTLSTAPRQEKQYEWWEGLKEWHTVTVQPAAGVWIPVVITVETRGLCRETPPGSLILRLNLKDFDPESRVYLDDMGLYGGE